MSAARRYGLGIGGASLAPKNRFTFVNRSGTTTATSHPAAVRSGASGSGGSGPGGRVSDRRRGQPPTLPTPEDYRKPSEWDIKIYEVETLITKDMEVEVGNLPPATEEACADYGIEGAATGEETNLNAVKKVRT